MTTEAGLPPLPSAYQPLQAREHIRLVRILHSNRDTEVACDILHTSFAQAPPYEAISYTWGGNEDRRTISCGPEGATIIVTKNCESMLRRLRRPQEDRLVWVDAICINQSDIPERNAQVALMAQIYQNASHVVADIGETSDTSEYAIFAIRNVSHTTLYSMDTGFEIRDSIDRLYRRPYFSRVWVLQELFMAQQASVLCGTTLTPWTDFRPSKIWVSSRQANETENWHVELPSITPNPLTIGSRLIQKYTAHKDFLPLLCKGRTSEATERRDKVFGLLPLLEDAKDEGLQADYAKSTETVFIETAAWLASHVGLSFLSCAALGRTSLQLPSWVPDWSVSFRIPWMLGLSGLFWPLNASLNSRSVAEVLTPPDCLPELKVRGLIVDGIRTLTGELDIRTADKYAAVEAFLSEFRAHRKDLGLGAAKLPSYRGLWNPTTSETRLHPPSWAIQYGLPFERAGDMTDNDQAGEMTYFCGNGRQLATTKSGYLGVMPEEARVGDLVCCFLGVGLPFVLRRVDEGCHEVREHFKLVGEAYVYGLMKGEAVDGYDLVELGRSKEPGPFQDFHIC